MTFISITTIAGIITSFGFVYLYNQKPGRHIGVLVIMLTAIAYPLGDYYKFSHVGPLWSRWHLADFGFIQFWSLLWAMFRTKMSPYCHLTIVSTSKYIYASSLMLELVQALAKSGFGHIIQNLDYIDCLMYTLGLAVVLVSIKFGVNQTAINENTQGQLDDLKDGAKTT